MSSILHRSESGPAPRPLRPASRSRRETDGVQTPREVVDLSVVIPLYNERDNVEGLCRRLHGVLRTLPMTWEILLVDDGSRDGTFEEIRRLQALTPALRALRLRKNFGQTAALAAGFDHARGAIVITLDGDLQNPPEEIPKLLAKLEEGYDLVSGWRVDRQDSFVLRVLPSRIANWLIGRITGTALHDYGCSLKAYRREILDDIQIHGDMHRFLPAFAGAVGARIAEIPVQHAPRATGRSKYGLLRTLVVLVDMVSIRFLLPYAFKPLKIFGLMGLTLLAGGGAINLYLLYQRLFAGHGISGRPLLLLGSLLVITGVQLVVLGILAELQSRSQLGDGRRAYAIFDRLGFARDDRSAAGPADGPPVRGE